MCLDRQHGQRASVRGGEREHLRVRDKHADVREALVARERVVRVRAGQVDQERPAGQQGRDGVVEVRVREAAQRGGQADAGDVLDGQDGLGVHAERVERLLDQGVGHDEHGGDVVHDGFQVRVRVVLIHFGEDRSFLEAALHEDVREFVVRGEALPGGVRVALQGDDGGGAGVGAAALAGDDADAPGVREAFWVCEVADPGVFTSCEVNGLHGGVPHVSYFRVPRRRGSGRGTDPTTLRVLRAHLRASGSQQGSSARWGRAGRCTASHATRSLPEDLGGG